MIREQASKVRLQFEQRHIDKKLLKELYSHYADVGDADVFVEKAFDLFPRLNCGLASVYLRQVLGTGQIIRGRYGNKKHTFLLIDGKVVDITADQYGGPKVYVGPLRKPWAKHF